MELRTQLKNEYNGQKYSHFLRSSHYHRDDDIFLQQLAVKEEEGGGVKHVFGKAPALLKGRDGGEKSSPSSTETGGVRDFLTYCREVRLDGLSNEVSHFFWNEILYPQVLTVLHCLCRNSMTYCSYLHLKGWS